MTPEKRLSQRPPRRFVSANPKTPSRRVRSSQSREPNKPTHSGSQPSGKAPTLSALAGSVPRGPTKFNDMEPASTSNPVVPPLRWAPGTKPGASQNFFVFNFRFAQHDLIGAILKLDDLSPRVTKHGAPVMTFAGSDSNAELIQLNVASTRSRRRSAPRPMRKVSSQDDVNMQIPTPLSTSPTKLRQERRKSLNSPLDSSDASLQSSDDDSTSGSAPLTSNSVSIVHESDAAWRCFSNSVLFERILLQLQFPDVISTIKVCRDNFTLFYEGFNFIAPR
jgi:hypothetical protein